MGASQAGDRMKKPIMPAAQTPVAQPARGLGIVFAFLAGLLFIAGGLWVRGRDAQERRTLIETSGTIVDSLSRTERSDGNSKVTYAPVIEFAANGDRTRFTGSYDSSKLSNGNTVVVRYDPANIAASARVVDSLEGLTPWAMIGMGIFSVAAGLVEVVKARRRA